MDRKTILQIVKANRKRVFRITGPFLTKKKVLDIGCGNGETGYFIHKTARSEISLVDVIDIRSRQARKLEFCIAPATKLPFASQVFDVAYIQFVLHHIGRNSTLLQVLKEAKRVAQTIIIIEELKNKKTDVKHAKKFDADINELIHPQVKMPIVQYYTNEKILTVIQKLQMKVSKNLLLDAGNKQNGFLETRLYILTNTNMSQTI